VPSVLEIADHVFIQLAIILVVCRAVGFGLRYLGQTTVVGEMVAGVLLGPSLLGMIAPGVKAWLFPASLTLGHGATAIQIPHPSMVLLYALGQLGLVVYMFLMGLEFNTSLVRKHLTQAGAISLAGVVVPIAFGGWLGFQLFGQPGLFGRAVAPWQAALFLAAAMSVTAFPVLARIIYDIGITRTRIGTLALGAAATNDAAAWCLLAVVLAGLSNNATIAILAVGGALAYGLFMAFIGRRWFVHFEFMTDFSRGLPTGGLVLLLFVVLLGAAFTDTVGIHSIFGAFIAGLVMPRGRFAESVRRSLEPLTMALLVPIFFVYSGLNTNLTLLTDPRLLQVALVVIGVAFAAKGGAVFLASWLNRTGVRSAAAIAVLMNCRGLMELILINIGLDRGVITAPMFTVLVLMTMVTTMLAAPLFQWIYRPEADADNPTTEPRVAPAGAG
jgi:Kef-type K+ transport system membrane component KefB